MKYALLVGVNDYKNPNSNLYCPVNDCYELKRTLISDKYNFIPFLLLDNEATKDNIKKHLMMLSEEEDLEELLFFFSGHGCSTRADTYICTYDYEKFDEGISVNQLSRMLGLFIEKNKKVTLVLDSCYSGAFELLNSAGYMPLIPDRIDGAFSSFTKNFSLIAACGGNEKSSQNAATGLSEFTMVLLEALSGRCADEKGRITPTMLYRYINENYSNKGWPRALFKATLSVDYSIGDGFAPGVIDVTDNMQAIQDTVDQGYSLLNDYIKIGEKGIEEWKLFQFSESSKRLNSIVTWLKSQESKFPELKINAKFTELKQATMARLKRLGSIEKGTIHNGFIFEDRLGAGSFGTVWKTRNLQTGQYRAFKVYHSSEIDIEEKVNRFRRGYKAMEILNHPQIVPVMDWYEAPYAFDMAYIDGLNLRECSGALSHEEQIIEFLLSIANILSYAHKHGVIHRDIKPENILAQWDANASAYVPKLTDFDLAWFDTATKMTKEALGSLCYASPEQVNIPNANVTHMPTVDIYSFGQILYFLIMGNDPRQNSSDYNLTNIKAKLSEWLVPSVAEGMEILYAKCTDNRARSRFQDFEDICVLLQELITAQKKLSDATISSDNYVDYILHGFKTISLSQANNGFISMTGRSQIAMAVKGHALEVTLSSNSLQVLDGLNAKSARDIVSKRFKEKFSGDRCVEVIRGHEGPLQIKLLIHLKALDIASLQTVRIIITKAISEMER